MNYHLIGGAGDLEALQDRYPLLDNECLAAAAAGLADADADADAAPRRAVVADRAGACLAVFSQAWPYAQTAVVLRVVVLRDQGGLDALLRFFRAFVQENRAWTCGIELNAATAVCDRGSGLARREVARQFALNCHRPPGTG